MYGAASSSLDINTDAPSVAHRPNAISRFVRGCFGRGGSEDAVATESTGLISRESAPAGCSYFFKSEKFWSNFGFLSTILAMVPQGIFAGLLMHHWLDDSVKNLPGLLIIDAIFLLTAIAGKAGLVFYYGEQNFIDLPKRDFRKTFGALLKVEAWLPAATAVIASLVFAYLAKLAMEGAADKVEEITGDAHSTSAEHLRAIYSWIIFAACSLFSNLLAFPGMISFGMFKTNQALANLTTPLSEYAQSLKAEKAYSAKLSAIQADAKAIAKDLRTLAPRGMGALDSAIAELLEKMTQNFVFDADGSSEMVVGGAAIAAQYLKPLLGLALAGMCVAGLSNFYTITQKFADDVHSSATRDLFAIMDIVAMSFLSIISVVDYPAKVMDLLAGRPQFNLLSDPKRYTLAGLAFFVSALGGLPNAWQSLHEGQPLVFMILALLASFFLELEGLNLCTHKFAKDGLFKQIKEIAGDNAPKYLQLCTFLEKTFDCRTQEAFQKMNALPADEERAEETQLTKLATLFRNDFAAASEQSSLASFRA